MTVLISLSRLHHSSEKILDNSYDLDARSKRKRRHHLRIFLLVLDYIVECIGGTFIFIVIFVAEKSLLQQHVLLTIGSFVFGVPIPLAYLLNETRVRTTIIQHGWLKGFKSIFLSSERIKQLERDENICFRYQNILCPVFPKGYYLIKVRWQKKKCFAIVALPFSVLDRYAIILSKILISEKIVSLQQTYSIAVLFKKINV